MYCGNCGTQNDDRAMFCQNCGAKLEGRAGGNQNQQWQHNMDYSYQNDIPGQVSIQGKTNMVEEALDDSGLYDLLDEDWEFNYEIGDAEDIKGAELQEIKDDCSDSGVKVSAAKSVDLKLTVTTEDGPESETVSIPLIKVGRKWYINIEEFMGLFY